jgi:hypothetical protein
MNTIFFCHRINTVSEMKNISNDFGIEVDLRDGNLDNLILAHDPFVVGESFDDFLTEYNKTGIILNIKSERVEYKVIELLKKHSITNYFFLDCSFPMIYQLNKLNEKNIAIRFSQFESIETIELVKNMVTWVWVDCFTEFPLTQSAYQKIKDMNLKICLVSPELQGHPVDTITKFKKKIIDNEFKIDAICTKHYNIPLWVSS